jgi:Fur family ferric uptake transcriptional regulator
VGVVSHTHLDHRSPAYHLADHADHVRLVCLSCGTVIESAAATADPFVGNLLTRHGFVADVKHMAIQGWCTACSVQETPAQATPSQVTSSQVTQ